MAPRFDEAPETVPLPIPEYHPPPTVPEVAAQPLPPVFKSENSTIYQYPGYGVSPIRSPSTHTQNYSPSTHTHNYDAAANAYLRTQPSDAGRRKEEHKILGCSVLVFVLAVIIAILSAAVVGLAAGTGVEANRANTAESKLAALQANTTSSSSPGSTAKTYDAVTRGCSTNSSAVSGTTYTSQFFDQSTYQIACNKDTPIGPLQGLFVANLDDCIDACASYTHHISENFANVTSDRNKTCSGVTFVPFWTDRQVAKLGTAPGNCYLKPGPQNKTALRAPNNGQETHSAFLVDDS